MRAVRAVGSVVEPLAGARIAVGPIVQAIAEPNALQAEHGLDS